MKIISWNVNGFRAAVKKGFYDFVEKESPDILALQELKMDKVPDFPEDFEYRVYWNPAERKGYSGTAVFTKEEPLGEWGGLGVKKFDKEGRYQELEFKNFYLVNAYFPHSQRELARLDFKLEFNEVFRKKVEALEKPAVLCGDFNVAHKEIDIARPKSNKKNAGFTPDERKWMDRLLEGDWVDSFRHEHPDKVQYSWWTYRFNARKRNIGWRIDYTIISESLLDRLEDAFIMGDVHGSDHVPVGVEIDLK